MSPDLCTLTALLGEIRACRHCEDVLPFAPRPLLRGSKRAKICIAGQAPGIRAHHQAMPFTDPSGVRLRQWMAVCEKDFYDPAKFAIFPMGFCYPGTDSKGGDYPPRRECAALWREKLCKTAGQIEMTLLVGSYAQKWHLGKQRKASLRETVRAFRIYMPDFFPLPHPSWRNNGWLASNPWFAEELLPVLRQKIKQILS